MTLEERYNTAAANTYAYRVRTTQAADVGSTNGVDFMDAGARTRTTGDTFQSNFKRRTENDKTFVQGGENTNNYNQSEIKGLSRWYGRALNYAFTDPRAPGNSIQNSVWTTYKSVRPDTKDSWTDNPSYFHRWTPSTKFNLSSTLSSLAKTRATGKTAPTT